MFWKVVLIDSYIRYINTRIWKVALTDYYIRYNITISPTSNDYHVVRNVTYFRTNNKTLHWPCKTQTYLYDY